jgi:hypothetical protein
LPAIVTIRVPSALCQVSCEPLWRTLIHPSRLQSSAYLAELLGHAPKLRGTADADA